MRAVSVKVLVAAIALTPVAALMAVQTGPGKKSDAERFVGTWRITKGSASGKELPAELLPLSRITFNKDGSLIIAWLNDAAESRGAYKILADGKIDFGEDNNISPGIYAFLADDQLTVCFEGKKGGQRPSKFNSETETEHVLLSLERVKAQDDTGPAMEKAKVAVNNMGAGPARTAAMNKLRNFALALLMHHDQQKHLPLHAIYSKDGKTPLLSWRVAILPYLEEMGLQGAMRLNEPWDSPYNKQFISRMPELFASPTQSDHAKAGLTHYQLFTGPGTLFDGATKLKLSNITDGTSNTILVIEAKEPVIWTKPEDLTLPSDLTKMPALGGLFKNTMFFATCDGKVHSAHNLQDPSLIRALVTPSGGEPQRVSDLKK